MAAAVVSASVMEIMHHDCQALEPREGNAPRQQQLNYSFKMLETITQFVAGQLTSDDSVETSASSEEDGGDAGKKMLQLQDLAGGDAIVALGLQLTKVVATALGLGPIAMMPLMQKTNKEPDFEATKRAVHSAMTEIKIVEFDSTWERVTEHLFVVIPGMPELEGKKAAIDLMWDEINKIYGQAQKLLQKTEKWKAEHGELFVLYGNIMVTMIAVCLNQQELQSPRHMAKASFHQLLEKWEHEYEEMLAKFSEFRKASLQTSMVNRGDEQGRLTKKLVRGFTNPAAAAGKVLTDRATGNYQAIIDPFTGARVDAPLEGSLNLPEWSEYHKGRVKTLYAAPLNAIKMAKIGQQ